ncbi:MAG: DNA-formamidopyrimidine glycosylase family protein [Bacteroidota bacterium]
MPELPDITLYVEHLNSRIAGSVLEKVRISSPFLLRSVDPPLSATEGKKVLAISRMGKRIVLDLEGKLFLVIHLMIAGRFRWEPQKAPLRGKAALAAFDFSPGTLLLTEAGTKRRASLHVVQGAENLSGFDRGGLEVLDAGRDEFLKSLTKENHTVKRALTDPRLFSGIGNAYSDEILHAAKLSPLKLTSRLTPDEIERLYAATRSTLRSWIQRLRSEYGKEFPTGVTAFRDGMAVHGRFGKPCPECGTTVQRIVYAENECNYCPRCQTEGRVLADRSLSRLLKGDWPRTVEELEDFPTFPQYTKNPGRNR